MSRPTANGSSPADVLLVGCAKSKKQRPAPAKDLYDSALFNHQRRYAESTAAPWFILSAEFGLVAPDEWLSPYERYLPETPKAYRTAWGAWVTARLELLAGPLQHKVVEIHAGSAYVDAIALLLAESGATVQLPLAGLGLGHRLQWYATRDRHDPIDRDDPATTVVPQLLDVGAAIDPATFLQGDRARLSVPGLYSWWIDEFGAVDLSRGLGEDVGTGLIYAGLAGATRWPSGKRSTNTLWSRIAGMHLSGRHEFSTFRRTLGSILAAAAGAQEINEVALSAWMAVHLSVRAVPWPDADGLGRLERAVLNTMDPPLNLMGMPATAVRVRIRELRRAHAKAS